MKITNINSATTIIETNGIKILTDPWFGEGIYYNSWKTYPPVEINPENLTNIDYIYISHIHPDHFSEESMSKLDKNIPILILDFGEQFLKRKLISQGFSNIIEINHNEKKHLKNNVYINILAADNCNPEICGKLFGCFFEENNISKTYTIDSMCVINNDEYVLVNTNDCPFPIMRETLELVKEQYPKVDFLMVGYTGASLYPFAMVDYNDSKMKEARDKTKMKGLNFAVDYINYLRPNHYFPFAGTYVLNSDNWKLNEFSPIPTLTETKEYINNKIDFSSNSSNCVLLNSGSFFELSSQTQSQSYYQYNESEKWEYLSNVLSKESYPFQQDDFKSFSDFQNLIELSFDRFRKKVNEIKYTSNSRIYIEFGTYCVEIDISTNFPNYILHKKLDFKLNEHYHYFIVDSRLFYRTLCGPRFAHWNNIEIGALLKLKRVPDIYEQGIHLSLCYFHK
jgi:UDP-MurNAc hydroxylase